MYPIARNAEHQTHCSVGRVHTLIGGSAPGILTRPEKPVLQHLSVGIRGKAVQSIAPKTRPRIYEGPAYI